MVYPHRTRSIPNARSAEEFHPPSLAERAKARREFGLADDQFVVTVIGSLSPEKRVDLALAAVALVPDAQLLLAGDGPERDQLMSATSANRDLETRVQFLGPVHDVLSILHASDTLLMTSQTEGMPGVLIEAGLCALPIVATNVGAIPWLLGQRVLRRAGDQP